MLSKIFYKLATGKLTGAKGLGGTGRWYLQSPGPKVNTAWSHAQEKYSFN